MRTPAKTRVMSSTRMPASGRVGESAVVAVARPRNKVFLEPLERILVLKQVRAEGRALDGFMTLLERLLHE